MQELEVKILEVNRSEIEAKLIEAGANKSFDGEMQAMLFDTKDRKIIERGDLLRLRKEGDKAVLTYKKLLDKGTAKIMEEYETAVSDVEETVNILALLGFDPTTRTRKFRTQYDLGKTHVVIDDYQDDLKAIPVFIEIEAPDLKTLYQIVEFLGYNTEDCKNWSTYDLTKHYLTS